MLSRKAEILVNALKPVIAVFFLPFFCVPASKVLHFISACTAHTKPWGWLPLYLWDNVDILVWTAHQKSRVALSVPRDCSGQHESCSQPVEPGTGSRGFSCIEWMGLVPDELSVISSWRCKFKKSYCRGRYNYRPSGTNPWSEGISWEYVKYAVLKIMVLLETPSWIRSRDSCYSQLNLHSPFQSAEESFMWYQKSKILSLWIPWRVSVSRHHKVLLT